jgi:rRNA maturation protein Nop10
LSERKELLNMLRAMWRQGDLSLRRIYPSLEELEANVDIIIDRKKRRGKERYTIQPCPNCGVKQKITKPEYLFPYHSCRSCKHPFHVNKDLTVRKLTEEEKENMPEDWVRILEDLNKKKLAIVFKLE